MAPTPQRPSGSVGLTADQFFNSLTTGLAAATPTAVLPTQLNAQETPPVSLPPLELAAHIYALVLEERPRPVVLGTELTFLFQLLYIPPNGSSTAFNSSPTHTKYDSYHFKFIGGPRANEIEQRIDGAKPRRANFNFPKRNRV